MTATLMPEMTSPQMLIPELDDHRDPLGSAIAASIPQPDWEAACAEVICLRDGVRLRGAYRSVRGDVQDFPVADEVERQVLALREQRRQSGQPLWSKARLTVDAQGNLRARWDFGGDLDGTVRGVSPEDLEPLAV